MTSLLSAAVELMLLGMGTVFVFLVVLIGATRLMSALVLATEGPQENVEAGAPRAQSFQGNAAQDARLVQVISEAIKQHRGQ